MTSLHRQRKRTVYYCPNFAVCEQKFDGGGFIAVRALNNHRRSSTLSSCQNAEGFLTYNPVTHPELHTPKQPRIESKSTLIVDSEPLYFPPRPPDPIPSFRTSACKDWTKDDLYNFITSISLNGEYNRFASRCRKNNYDGKIFADLVNNSMTTRRNVHRGGRRHAVPKHTADRADGKFDDPLDETFSRNGGDHDFYHHRERPADCRDRASREGGAHRPNGEPRNRSRDGRHHARSHACLHRAVVHRPKAA